MCYLWNSVWTTFQGIIDLQLQGEGTKSITISCMHACDIGNKHSHTFFYLRRAGSNWLKRKKTKYGFQKVDFGCKKRNNEQ